MRERGIYRWRVKPFTYPGNTGGQPKLGNVVNVWDLRCRGSHPEMPNGSSEGRSGDGSQRVGEIVGGARKVLEEDQG